MRIAVLCATRRGRLFLEKLFELAPADDAVVFSFREEPWEPPFLDDIRAVAAARGAEFVETRQVGSPRCATAWERPVDLMFVVSWRYLIPQEVYRRPRLGTFVFHDSLLPEYRGFSPTVWAMINGEPQTGVTLFEIAQEVDAGDVVDQQAVPIGPEECIGAVLERVTDAYLELLARNLDALRRGAAPRRPQDHGRATYTCKRLPEDNRIDWSAPAARAHNLIRATGEPYPGAFTVLAGRRLRVWSASRLPGARRYVGAVPGRVLEVRPGEGSVVLAGDEPLLLRRVQLEGECRRAPLTYSTASA